jgi:hypothetical protein
MGKQQVNDLKDASLTLWEWVHIQNISVFYT